LTANRGSYFQVHFATAKHSSLCPVGFYGHRAFIINGKLKTHRTTTFVLSYCIHMLRGETQSFFCFRCFFPQQRKLGVFSHSKGPGAGRGSQIRTAQGWEPGSQEGVSFSKRIPKQGFPGSQEQVPKQGSQEQVPRQGSQEVPPSKVPRKRFPSKVSSKLVPKQGFQEEVPKQGSQEEVPKQGFQARFPGTGSQVMFPRGSHSQQEDPRNRFPSKVPRKRFAARFSSKVPRQGYQEQIPKQRFPGTESEARLLGRGSQARFPGNPCSWKFCLGTSSSWGRLLENLFLRALFVLGTLLGNGSWDLAWEPLPGRRKFRSETSDNMDS